MTQPKQKEAKRINVELDNAQSRIAALPKLKRLLQYQNEIVLSENIINWLKILCQIISSGDDGTAVEIFSIIMSQACQVPSISRDISTKLVPSILDDFLKIKEKHMGILRAIEAILKNYPTSCGSLRTHVVKTMLSLMMSSRNGEFLDTALRCWSQSSFIGGGGHQRSNHCQQWLNQFKECIAALKFAFNCYLGDDEGKVDASIGSFSLPFAFLPTEEPQYSDAVIKRISIVCRCLIGLMTVEFPQRLPFPLDSIMELILRILDILPSQLGDTTEMVHRASFLSQIHGDVLTVLEKLMIVCGRNLCRSSSDINNMFSGLLDLWEDKLPIHGRNKMHQSIREKIYETIVVWIQNCGATTRFLCGQKILNHNLLRHILSDIKPIIGNTISVNKVNSSEGGKKAKRRRMAEATKEMLNGNTTERIRDVRANQFSTSSALEVVIATATTMSHRLSDDVARNMQDEVISLILRLQTSEEIIPFHKCIHPRWLLYKALLTFVLTPPGSLPPPSQIATKIFSCAISRERSHEIRNFCQYAISTLSCVVHPRRYAWHIYAPPSKDKTDTFKGVSTMQPVNVASRFAEEESESDDNEFESEPTRKLAKITGSPKSNQPEQKVPKENGFPKILPEAESPVASTEDNQSESMDVTQTLGSPTEHATSEIETDDITTVNGAEEIPDSTRQVTDKKEDEEVKSIQNGTAIESSQSSSSSDGNKEVNEELNEMLLDFVDASPDHE